MNVTVQISDEVYKSLVAGGNRVKGTIALVSPNEGQLQCLAYKQWQARDSPIHQTPSRQSERGHGERETAPLHRPRGNRRGACLRHHQRECQGKRIHRQSDSHQLVSDKRM